MKKLLSVGVLCLLFVIGAVRCATQPAERDRGVTDRFAGAWRLALLEQPGADGKVRTIDCCGVLVFTRDGHISVQVMEREPRAGLAAGPEQYSQGGYEASYGSYRVNERDRTFTFRVEGALVRSLIGKDLPRAYEFSGNRLIVKSTRPDEHWRVTWERY